MFDLTPILSHGACEQCRNCCAFKPESLFYVPQGIDVLENSNGMFICSHCDSCGCRLGDSKPVECAAWPFSISKYENTFALVLEHTCPVLNEGDLNEIKDFAIKNIAANLYEYAMQNLNSLREYDKRNRILHVF